MEYLILNSLLNNMLIDDSTVEGTFDEMCKSAIDSYDDFIKEILDEIMRELNGFSTDHLDSILMNGQLSSQSIDSFSVSYTTKEYKSIFDLLPLKIRILLNMLGIGGTKAVIKKVNYYD